jgi:hypothetical protein
MIGNPRYLVLGCILVCYPALAVGQTSACQSVNDESSKLVTWVTGIVTGTDSADLSGSMASVAFWRVWQPSEAQN